ncbi:MAG: SurA N-terminal domain-containing protein [Alphaproteobacteria bacterium]|nr:SurA N-terminal domain-containing protein [Alphaproteobacteria bacterium]
MLQAIRSRAASWVVKALFVLLILSFAAWGITDYINRGTIGRVHVATVGDRTIEPQDLSRAIDTEIQRLRGMLGPGFDRDQARQFGIADSVLEQLISNLLIQQESQRLGLGVSDAGVRAAIVGDRLFAGADGQFDRTRFQSLLARANYTEARYVAELRQDLPRQHLLATLQRSVRAPQVLAETILRFREEQRVAMTAILPASLIPEPAAPTEDALVAFHRDNATRFTAPERRTATVLVLGPEQVIGGIDVPPSAVEEAYRLRVGEFTTPGRRQVTQLLFADEAAAKAARERLVGGTPMAEVAADPANLAGAETSLGEITGRDLPRDLAGPVFAAAANSVIEPVRSPLGWHVFSIGAVTAEVVQPFEAVREQLALDLRRERALDRVIQLTNRLEDALSSNASLEEAAQEVGAALIKAERVDRRGFTEDRTRPVGLPTGDAVLRTIFETAEGRTTQRVIEADRETMVAVRVDGVAAPQLRPLDEVRTSVLASWIAAERDRALRTLAEATAERIRTGTAFQEALPEGVTEAAVSEPFTREGRDTPIPAALVAQLFQSPVGTVAVAQAADGYMVAQLADIRTITPDPSTIDQQRQNFSAGMGEDVVRQFEQALRQRYTVTINRREVERAF